MSNNSHAILTLGASRKRKERDGLDALKASTSANSAAHVERRPDNLLLAGCLAHEFLTKGTLLGQVWDPSGANPSPSPRQESSKKKPIPNPSSKSTSQAEPKATQRAHAYAEIAHLLKTNGPHIPGVVNPTQLGRWMRM